MVSAELGAGHTNTNEIVKAWLPVVESRFGHMEESHPGLADEKEYAAFKSWYLGGVEGFKDLKHEDIAIGGAGGIWRGFVSEQQLLEIAKLTETAEGPIIEIPVGYIGRPDGGFFNVQGVQTYYLDSNGEREPGWDQAWIVAKHKNTLVMVYGKEYSLPVHGILGLVRSTGDEVLCSLGQEAGAVLLPNRVAVKSSLIGSFTKIDDIIAGVNVTKDQVVEVLETLGDGSVEKALEEGVFYPNVTDFNRKLKVNVVTVLPQVEVGSEQHEQLSSGQRRMWLTPFQQTVASAFSLVNEHTDQLFAFDANVRKLANRFPMNKR